MRIKYIVALVVAAVLLGLVPCVLKFQAQQTNQPPAKAVPTLDLTKEMAEDATNKFSPLGTTTDEILSHENDAMKDDVMGALLWRLGQKSERIGWDNLSDAERRLVAVDALNEEVLDGGFKEYFSDSLGGDAAIALAGLKDMGATNVAGTMERAMAVFPGSTPPTGYDERNAIMDKIKATAEPVWQKCDDAYDDQTDNLDALELAYAKKKKADIVLP